MKIIKTTILFSVVLLILSIVLISLEKICGANLYQSWSPSIAAVSGFYAGIYHANYKPK